MIRHRHLPSRLAALLAATAGALLHLGAQAAPYAFGNANYGVATAAGTYVGFTRGCDATYNNGYGLGTHIQINGTGGTPCAPSPYSGADGNTPYSIVYDGTLDATGLRTSSFDNTRLQINGPNGAFGQASAAADLATASLHGLALGAGPDPGGYGSRSANVDTYLHDTLHFTVNGASADTKTLVTVRLSLDGSTADLAGASLMDLLWAWKFGSAGVVKTASNWDANGNSYSGVFKQQSEQLAGWFSFNRMVDALSPDNTDIVLEGLYELIGASEDVDIASRLSLFAENASLNYMNTGKLSLILPSNVSFTSDSGVFLTGGATDPGNQVPEPSSWALVLAALASMRSITPRRAS